MAWNNHVSHLATASLGESQRKGFYPCGKVDVQVVAAVRSDVPAGGLVSGLGSRPTRKTGYGGHYQRHAPSRWREHDSCYEMESFSKFRSRGGRGYTKGRKWEFKMPL